MSALHNDYQAVPTNSVVLVTPEIAKNWLESNTNNRNIRKVHLQNLVDDMQNDRWLYNGESIKFDVEGNLIDGQHRLFAVMLSGCSLPMLVVVNLPTLAQQTVDIGRARTTSDMAQLQGVKSSTVTAASAAIVLRYKNYPDIQWTNSNMPTKTTIINFITDNQERFEGVAAQSQAAYKNFGIRETVYSAFSFMVQDSPNYKFFYRFHNDLLAGSDLRIGDARLTLRNQIMRSVGQRKTAWGQQEQFALTIKTWNAYITGKSLKLLKFAPDNLPMPTIN